MFRRLDLSVVLYAVFVVLEYVRLTMMEVMLQPHEVVLLKEPRFD